MIDTPQVVQTLVVLDRQIMIWGITTAAGIGAFQAVVLWRLFKIEEKLGNGKPGVFARKETLELLVKDAEESHDEMKQDIRDLQTTSSTLLTRIIGVENKRRL